MSANWERRRTLAETCLLSPVAHATHPAMPAPAIQRLHRVAARPPGLRLVLCLPRLLATALALISVATQAATYRTEANVAVEIQFQSARPHADPFNDLTVDVVFTDPVGQPLRVPAFWDGGAIWKARYASSQIGTHRYHTECSDRSDAGLQGAEGTVEIKSYTGANPLFAHGPLRVAADRRHLEHADGTPFFWLGDTWWMGLCHRLHWPDEFQQLATDRRAKGFNVIQIVAGLYPDMPPFDPRGANEAGFPWETNYARIRPAYFDAADRRLGSLVESGFTPCLVGAWGYFLPWMGVEKAKQHWRYLIARYGAWPVVWCIAGEANLPYYLAKGFPYDDREQVKGWTEVARYVRQTDPFHRLITIHPTGIGRLSARHAIDDVSLLDIDLLQTPHGQREAVPPTLRTIRESYADQPVLPVIDGEASYEMLNDTIPAEWPRAMFWVCLLNGAAGHTYGANGIWQCNRRGAPHGASPHGGSYGKLAWDDAMRLPGSSQVGFGKRLLERYPWQRFTPHPEWAAFGEEPAVTLEGSRWIWYPEGEPAKDAPVAQRFFRKSFVLPEDRTITGARLFLSADDWFEARLNGQVLGADANWRTGRQFNAIAPRLRPGTNVLAIVGENKPANVPANPAGLLATLEVRFAGGKLLRVITDANWRSARDSEPGWDGATFDDSAWAKAKELGRYGDGPWGRIGGADLSVGPQAAGIADFVRIIWVPRSEPILVSELGPSRAWAAAFFDPVNGGQKALGTVRADAAGLWRCEAPAGASSDWVLILETKR